MSVRNKLAALVGAVTLAATLGLAGASSTWAATPSCGSNCVDVFSKQFGTFHNPQFVMDVLRQGAKVNQPVILFPQANSDPAEDFTFSFTGTVSDLAATAGLVSNMVKLHYGCNRSVTTGLCSTTINPLTGQPFPDDYAFEVEYSPYGTDSGLCVGLASTAFQGEHVSLQPCGVTAKTIWITDTLDSCPSNPLYKAELPVINGSDTNFSHPYVLTYPSSGYPTDKPRPQLQVTNLTGFSQTGGTGSAAVCGGSAVTGPQSQQLWSAKLGVLN